MRGVVETFDETVPFGFGVFLEFFDFAFRLREKNGKRFLCRAGRHRAEVGELAYVDKRIHLLSFRFPSNQLPGWTGFPPAAQRGHSDGSHTVGDICMSEKVG